MGAKHVAAACAALSVGCGASVETASQGDAGTDKPEAGVDILGAWHVCAERIAFEADRTWTVERFREGCRESGHYELGGELLDIAVDESDCKQKLESLNGIRLVRSGARLHFIHETFSRIYFGESIPRARYRFAGQGAKPEANGTSIVRVIGEPEAISACYWSEDGACGGVFSCGGVVDWWNLAEGEVTARFGCSGDCPCATIVKGTASGEALSGGFDGIDCQGPYDGTFEAQKLSNE